MPVNGRQDPAPPLTVAARRRCSENPRAYMHAERNQTGQEEERSFRDEMDEAGGDEDASQREDGQDDGNSGPGVDRMENVKFIHALQNASLDNGDLSPQAMETLLNPPDFQLELDEEADRALLLCIRLFIANTTGSQQNLSDSVDAMNKAFPQQDLLTVDQIKRRMAHLSGIQPIIKDMCPNTCAAYTGEFEALDSCLKCGESRYAVVGGAPRQSFYTLPIGPSVQALRRHPQSAQHMLYFDEKTQSLLEENETEGHIKIIDDICCGMDILEAVSTRKIKKNDTILMMSLDGAQLYRDKISDCWIYIWIFVNLSPDRRYKKKHVIPGGFIPGPHKPKVVDSFLFLGLHHIEAINRLPGGGLPIWDAFQRICTSSHLYIILATADGPRMTYLNGLVGHSGKVGCRLWCGLVGRHKAGQPKYYPVLFKPDDYAVAGCNHEDVPPHQVRSIDCTKYLLSLAEVCASPRQGVYEIRRRESGICKPSIFSGLSPDSILGIPRMFPGDIMHLVLNLADILLNLWRGNLACESTDSKATWYWAVLVGNVWKEYGEDVANCTPYHPGSHDTPPRNPAEKINSGYKAWEHLGHLFGVGPGLLYRRLPFDIWQSYCKLVFGFRFIYQKRMRADGMPAAHIALIQFIAEFEKIYVQRRTDRIHFVRQSIHALSHLVPEALRIGPGACSSQWTMECSIGNLTEEIKQDVNPYANLSERGLRRAEVNALKTMVPKLDLDAGKEGFLPRGGLDIGHGYALLCARDTCARDLEPPEAMALKTFLRQELDIDCEAWKASVIKWAHLRLPNGQIARTAWKEKLKPLGEVRMSRNVKLQIQSKLEFAEVQFYFQLKISLETTKTLALVSLYSPPDSDLLTASSNTVWSCKYQGDDALRVVDVSTIESVVAIVPHSARQGSDLADCFFVVEKPGLDIAAMGGVAEEMTQE
ncbi:hypothetical protein JAAARDRAFT_73289 [Jaapia argillacea MUCL 33604]|uniref:Uncharacterized protein n=1 Tax=Jaapia argillacea MUCL 33604 TaxID=933084 RepID=A0A067PNS1_9AGAM|nr:hypothetical protein JAAARDRAFT_73289 [Jaapia argillacea MUCL 33604]